MRGEDGRTQTSLINEMFLYTVATFGRRQYLVHVSHVPLCLTKHHDMKAYRGVEV